MATQVFGICIIKRREIAIKIAIVGTGRVVPALHTGPSSSFVTIWWSQAAARKKQRGGSLDLQHALDFCSRPMLRDACANGQVREADIIVMTTSVAIEDRVLTSRMQLSEKNTAMPRASVPIMATHSPNAVLIIAVDLCFLANLAENSLVSLRHFHNLHSMEGLTRLKILTNT